MAGFHTTIRVHNQRREGRGGVAEPSPLFDERVVERAPALREPPGPSRRFGGGAGLAEVAAKSPTCVCRVVLSKVPPAFSDDSLPSVREYPMSSFKH